VSQVTDQSFADIVKLVHINRCTKVVKGGRRLSFSSLVVVGDGKGKVGFGKGNANEINDAKNKATAAAKRNMIRVPLKDGRTLHHDVVAKFCSGKVIMRSAPAGTGVIAGGALRPFLEALGIKDIVVKSIGSSNPHTMVRAAMEALKSVRSPRYIAEKRGKSVGEIIRYKNNSRSQKPTNENETIQES
jgi:small subunit ribosomal protein S5